MTSMNVFRPFAPIQFAHKVRQVSADSWWVYRHEIGQGGYLKPMPRIVFFGQSKSDIDQWIALQEKNEQMIIVTDF